MKAYTINLDDTVADELEQYAAAQGVLADLMIRAIVRSRVAPQTVSTPVSDRWEQEDE